MEDAIMEAIEVDSFSSMLTRESKKIAPIRKRFQEASLSQAPAIILSPDGSILQMTPSACHLLEYRSDQSVESCFFSHVHGRNLYQVMRDVADMVCYGKAGASWLLRLRTGQGRWRWYKATVKNLLTSGEGNIVINLRDLHDW
jgi:PAS domain-containing protein